MSDKTCVYIAGPMRGIPEFNFPAFDAAKVDLIARGYDAISPADLDRESGFDPAGMAGTTDDLRGAMFDESEAIRNDITAIIDRCGGGIVLLPGWENSRGCAVEVAVARFLGLPVRIYPTLKDAPDAMGPELIKRERRKVYGEPRENHCGIAQMWAPLLQPWAEQIANSEPLPEHVIALLMAAMKLARMRLVFHADNYDDIINYLSFAREWQAKTPTEPA